MVVESARCTVDTRGSSGHTNELALRLNVDWTSTRRPRRYEAPQTYYEEWLRTSDCRVPLCRRRRPTVRPSARPAAASPVGAPPPPPPRCHVARFYVDAPRLPFTGWEDVGGRTTVLLGLLTNPHPTTCTEWLLRRVPRGFNTGQGPRPPIKTGKSTSPSSPSCYEYNHSSTEGGARLIKYKTPFGRNALDCHRLFDTEWPRSR